MQLITAAASYTPEYVQLQQSKITNNCNVRLCLQSFAQYTWLNWLNSCVKKYARPGYSRQVDQLRFIMAQLFSISSTNEQTAVSSFLIRLSCRSGWLKCCKLFLLTMSLNSLKYMSFCTQMSDSTYCQLLVLGWGLLSPPPPPVVCVSLLMVSSIFWSTGILPKRSYQVVQKISGPAWIFHAH